MLLPVRVLCSAFTILAFCAGTALAAPVESFRSFISSFEEKAVRAGVSREVYRDTMYGLTPDPDIPEFVATQPEFTTPVWEYIEVRVSDGRVSRGRAAMAANMALFERIGRQFGVDPYLLGAIWGIESDYGAILDNPKYIKPVIRSLATLVHQRRGRVEADEAELIAALKLVQSTDRTAETLVGSWAGAIGHLQTASAGVVRYGTDGDGDGQVDPHTSLADALATCATFLKTIGYQSGVDWGYEVEVPAGFDYMLASREQLRPISFFVERGVKRVAGRQFAQADEPVFLYVPAGKDGPKFLMTRNYLVLKGYNFSDSYAMAVAHLTDRLKGAGPYVQAWPKSTKFPNREQRVAIQRMLRQLGFYEGDAEGRIGPITQAAYARFQASRGLVADGFVTHDSYLQLREATR